MKKVFQFVAVAMVALLGATSCEKEATAVLPENMNSKVTIVGEVKWKGLDYDSTYTSLMYVNEGTEVTIFYTANESDKPLTYYARVDASGCYSIDLGVPAGRSIAKVQAEVHLNGMEEGYSTYGKTKDDYTLVDAMFYGSDSKTSLYAGKTYRIDLTATPYVCPTQKDVRFDVVK